MLFFQIFKQCYGTGLSSLVLNLSFYTLDWGWVEFEQRSQLNASFHCETAHSWLFWSPRQQQVHKGLFLQRGPRLVYAILVAILPLCLWADHSHLWSLHLTPGTGPPACLHLLVSRACLGLPGGRWDIAHRHDSNLPWVPRLSQVHIL